MLTIVFGDSELELVPKEIFSHPAVNSYARQRGKKPNEIILDSSFHHSALKDIHEGLRRGRPDIIHICLLNALESIANKKKELNIIVHTRNNEAIYFNPNTRLMRNYTRFIGLIEQLFQKKKIETDDETLIELKSETSIEKIINEVKHDFVIVFSPDGKKVVLSKHLSGLKKKKYNDLLCIIGGFPHGGFKSDVSKLADDVISIYDETLSAWTVTNELLVNYENVFL